MGQRKTQCLTDHLRGCGGPQKLAAPAGRGTSATASFGGFLQRDLAVGVARSDALDATGILAVFGQQGNAARNEDAGKVRRAGEGHHHGRQPLVASCHADDTTRSRQRANQPTEDHGSIIAIRQ